MNMKRFIALTAAMTMTFSAYNFAAPELDLPAPAVITASAVSLYESQDITITNWTGKAITVSGSHNGAKCYLSAFTNSSNQQFQLVWDHSTNCWLIKHKSSGKLLEVRDFSTADCGEVGLWEDASQMTARWKLHEKSDGTFSLENAYSGKYLNVYGNYSDDNTPIIQYRNDGTSAMFFNLNMGAAVSYPSVSSSRPLKLVSDGYYNVYGSSSLTNKIGCVYPGDEVSVTYISSSCVKLSYPTSSGTKTGYCSTASILGTPTASASSKRSFKVYKYSSGSSSYGSVDTGDSLTVLGASGGRTAVIYNVGSSSNPSYYKLGWASSSDVNSALGNSSGTSSAEWQTLSSALYQNSGAWLSCGFNGYTGSANGGTDGKHEGIDFVYYNGADVYALTDGVVTNVKSGYTGRSGLSIISVYNAETDKTVCYLHLCPDSSIYVGKSISTGEKIGTQSWRGISSSSSGHTHVEVVNGWSTSAKKSVNDDNLENDDPTSFWNSFGYTIG